MVIDHVSDLHWDNGMMRSKPLGWLGRIDVAQYRRSEADVLVVAGDTSNHHLDTADFLAAAAEHCSRVVAVHGNHERLHPVQAQLPTNVYLLDDLPGHTVTVGGVAFVGGCLAPEDAEAIATVVAAVSAAQDDPALRAVVVVSHYVPTPKVGDIIDADIQHKANDLLDRLPAPAKLGVIVFGHLHIEVDTVINGWRMVSNPRGYRGLRRDGSAWTGFGQIEI